jgi:hypothetical protein
MDRSLLEQGQDIEIYLFGLSSPSIRSRRIAFSGGGVYATNRRLFVVRGPLKVRLMFVLPFLTWIALYSYGLALYYFDFSSMAGLGLGLELLSWVFYLAAFLTFLYKDSSRVPIPDLERRKIFDMELGQVSRIVLKDRGNWWVSSIAIFSETGEKRVIRFGANGSFKHVWRCLQLFRPEVLVYIPF